MRNRSFVLLTTLFPFACAAPEGALDARPEIVAKAAAEVQVPRVSDTDIEHYAIDLTLLPDERRIEATCTVRLYGKRPGVGSVTLDLEGLDVSRVTDEQGRELAFEHDRGELRIALGHGLAEGVSTELSIEYSGSPRKGLWFVEDGGSVTQVFTQGECEDSRWWFPCWDAPSDRATSELTVDVPSGWRTLAAGVLIDSETVGNRRTDRWRMTTPHPTYLTTLVAGDFLLVEQEWEGVPLVYLAPKPLAPYLLPSLSATPEALGFLSELTGRRYPYEKYAQACVDNFPFGGMENISATTLTTAALVDDLGRIDRPSDGLVVHEAAHQWFGDLLTCEDWSHVWLNEGFATYATQLFTEKARGADEFRVGTRAAQEAYLEAEGRRSRAIVHDMWRDPMDVFFSGHAYEGGATRLHLLRFVLGDDAFFRGLRAYVGRNVASSVTTADLREALELASGEDLSLFFRQWLESPGHPVFEVRWRWDPDRARVLLTVNQTQQIGLGVPEAFVTPVDVEVRTSAGAKIHRVVVDTRRHQFTLPADSEPEWVRFDKYGWLPAEVISEKRPEEWFAIVHRDDDVNGRLDALEWLMRSLAGSDDDVRQGVVSAALGRLEGDRIPAVRSAAARVLARAGGDSARRALELAATSEPDARVRIEALRALESWGRDLELADLAKRVYETRVSWDTMGAAAGLLVAADPTGAFDWIVARNDPDSPHGDLRRNLLAQLARSGKPQAIPELVQWARRANAPIAVREQAVRGLGDLRADGEEAQAVLVGLLDSPLARLRRAAVETLSRYDGEWALAALERHYDVCITPRERRAIETAFARTAQ